MRVAKDFGWEAAHRLPHHAGLCSNLHGHSYRMTVEMEGEPDEHGIVIDFQDIKAVIKPLIDEWDHSTLVSKDDIELLGAVRKLGDRHVVIPCESTAENLCVIVADYVRHNGSDVLEKHAITSMRIRIQETGSCFAEHEVMLT
ncbi:MAG: 6-carboxytetrahydropterin synthase [Rhodothermales bacterium]|nr:6-carboxytetrahydropterin synthase [Rhodothermales bacterium]